MQVDPYRVTRDFESALSAYTGAPHVVCVNSCTAALMLAIEWHHRPGADYPHLSDALNRVEIPRRTYVSVPCAIRLAGQAVTWRNEDWRGAYQLKPLPIWDCARRFTSGMYIAGQFQCLCFSAAKILGIEQGGAILHDNAEADPWFRKMRFDGRTEGVDPQEDTFDLIGHHCIMLPSIAAQALLRLYHLPKDNPDMPEGHYPDLSKHSAFR